MSTDTDTAEAADTIVHEGKFLRYRTSGTWEYVERTNITGIVVIVAITDDSKLVLVEQFRPPVNANVIELPAGLAGDAGETESLLTAAKRELLEETGYEAKSMEIAVTGAPSAGLSNEMITLVIAGGLKKVAAGGGVDGENITVHEVAIDGIETWLKDRQAAGAVIDLKIFAGIHCAFTCD